MRCLWGGERYKSGPPNLRTSTGLQGLLSTRRRRGADGARVDAPLGRFVFTWQACQKGSRIPEIGVVDSPSPLVPHREFEAA